MPPKPCQLYRSILLATILKPSLEKKFSRVLLSIMSNTLCKKNVPWEKHNAAKFTKHAKHQTPNVVSTDNQLDSVLYLIEQKLSLLSLSDITMSVLFAPFVSQAEVWMWWKFSSQAKCCVVGMDLGWPKSKRKHCWLQAPGTYTCYVHCLDFPDLGTIAQ